MNQGLMKQGRVKGIRNSSPRFLRGGLGFTLTELLVVIAIIGILAALVIGLLPTVNQSRVRTRVNAEKASLTAMIEHYKSKKGFYPPDGRRDITIPGNPQKVVTNLPATLYHELTTEAPSAANVFIANSGEDKQSFARNLKESQYREIGGFKIFGIPTKGPEGDFCYWRYDASSTNRHNPEGFDLWIEVLIKGEKHTFKNWSGE